jgi:hypothetical protein
MAGKNNNKIYFFLPLQPVFMAGNNHFQGYPDRRSLLAENGKICFLLVNTYLFQNFTCNALTTGTDQWLQNHQHHLPETGP